MIEQALESAVISSAGGDSPKKNYVFKGSVNINPIDFEDILDNKMRDMVAEAMPQSVGTGTSKEPAQVGGIDQAKDTLSLLTGNIGATPQSIVASLVPLLGPAMLIFMLPQIVKFVINEMIKPGGPFDVRFKREIQKEHYAFYNRQTQWDTQYGYRNVIIQGVDGFKAEQGSFHGSTFRDIKEGTGNGYRMSTIGLTDKAYGFMVR